MPQDDDIELDYEYGDHHNDSSDNYSDDDNDDDEDRSSFLGLGSGKRKRVRGGQGYTTFDNDVKPKKSSKQRRDEALYGVFMDSSYSSSTNHNKSERNTTSGEVSFVPAKKVEVKPDDDDNNNNNIEKDLEKADESKTTTSPMEDANQKFLKLLNRAKGTQKSSARTKTQSQSSSSSQRNQESSQVLGLGFRPSNNTAPLHDSNSTPSNPDTPSGLGLGLGNHSSQGLGLGADLGLGNNSTQGLGLGSSSNRDDNNSMNNFFSASSTNQNKYNNNNGNDNANSLYSNFFTGGSQTIPKKEPPKNPDIGKWEKHTKGIGMKLLAKMGFSGSGGLGKRNKSKTNSNTIGGVQNNNSGAGIGISKPVEVVVRPANLGLGYGNFKEASRLKSNRQIEAEVRGTTLKEEEQEEDDLEKKYGDLLSGNSSRRKDNFSNRSGGHKKKKQQFKFVSYESIIDPSNDKEASEKDTKGETKMKIIDMRGPQITTTTTTTTTSSMGSSQKQRVSIGDELLHNVSLLVNTYESRLQMSHHLHKSNEQKLKSIQQDVQSLGSYMKEISEKKSRMMEIQRLMKQLQEVVQNVNVDSRADTTQSISNVLPPLLSKIRASFIPHEIQSLHLNDIILPSLLQPALEKHVQSWNPMKHPEFIVDAIQLWRPLLSGMGETQHDKDNDNKSHLETMDATEMEDIKRALALSSAELLLFQHLISRIRNYILTKWGIFDARPCVSLYKVLLAAAKACENVNIASMNKDILAESPLSNRTVEHHVGDLMESIILPKVTGALRDWTPSVSSSSNSNKLETQNEPQNWILPWLPYLTDTMRAHLFTAIERKLKNSFLRITPKRRQPIDKSDVEVLYSILIPWKEILPLPKIHDLMSKHILPQIANALRLLEINPSNQDLSILQIIQKFHQSQCFPSHTLVSLLEGEFCLKWLNVLYEWLFDSNAATTNTGYMDEVAQFYLGWKQMILVDLSLSHDEVMVRYFYTALHMMNLSIQRTKNGHHNDVDKLQKEIESRDIDELQPPGAETMNFQMVLRRRKREVRYEEKQQQHLENKGMDAKMYPSKFSNSNTYQNRSKGQSTFREMLEDFAMEHGILLVPRRENIDANATVDGKRVYNFGKIPIYLDETIVFALLKKNPKDLGEGNAGPVWTPISLDDLIVAHQNC